MLSLFDEIQPFIERKFPLLRVHRYDGTRCSCAKEHCQWSAEKGGSAGKHPAERNGVHDAEARESAKVFEGLNAGVACGYGFVVLDIDPRNGGDESLARLIGANEPLPRTWQVASGGGGTHYYFKVEGEQRSGKRVDGVDLIGLGGYVLAPGSVHPSQKQYEWEIHPSECEMAALPEWVITECCRPKIKQSIKREFEGTFYDEQDVADILKVLDPNVKNDDWVSVGMALKDGGYSVDVFDDWSKQGRNYAGRKDIEIRWKSFKDKEDGIHFGSLIRWGEDAGWCPRTMEKWQWIEPVIVEPEPEPKVIAERELPRGIAGIVAQDIYDVAMHKDKGFAIETVLMCIAVAAQMRFRTSVKKGVLHKYSVLLTQSGGGKAEYTNAAKTILKQVSQHLLIGDCASGQALRMSMQQCPSRGMVRDEGVERLIALSNEKDANATRLHEDFLSMWGGAILEEIKTKDSANASPQIDNPHMSFLFGGPTTSFETMLKNGMALSTKGLLSRMDIIFGSPTKPKSGDFSTDRVFEPRKEFIELLKKIAGITTETKLDTNQKKVLDVALERQLSFARWQTEDVRFIYDDFASYCYDETHSYTHSAVWSRVAERSLRDATLLAIVDNYQRPIITQEHVEWGKRDALWKVQFVKNKCEEFLGKSDETKVRDKIVSVLKKEGGRCSRKRIAKWWPQWEGVEERVRQAAIDGLQRDGIVSVTTSGANRNKGEQIFVLLST